MTIRTAMPAGEPTAPTAFRSPLRKLSQLTYQRIGNAMLLVAVCVAARSLSTADRPAASNESAARTRAGGALGSVWRPAGSRDRGRRHGRGRPGRLHGEVGQIAEHAWY